VVDFGLRSCGFLLQSFHCSLIISFYFHSRDITYFNAEDCGWKKVDAKRSSTLLTCTQTQCVTLWWRSIGSHSFSCNNYWTQRENTLMTMMRVPSKLKEELHIVLLPVECNPMPSRLQSQIKVTNKSKKNFSSLLVFYLLRVHV